MCNGGKTTMKYTKKKKFVELENINGKEVSMKKPEQKVVATAKKHKVLKKALVSLALVSAIGACVFLTACNKKDNDKTNGITPPTTQQGEQTGGNQGGQENQGGQTGENQGGQTGGNQGGQENQGGQTGGNQGGQENQGEQTGGNQGGQENQGGQTGGQETPNPEKTPAEYKAECEQKISDKLEEKIDEWWGEDGAKVSSFKLNTVDGTIYAKAKIAGANKDSFFTIKSNLSGSDNLSYKQISEKCDDLSLKVQKKDVILSSIVSSDKYNALCNYVLSQYDLQDGEILNVTKFSSMNSMRGTILTVLYGDKIYSVEARCHSPTTDAETCIDLMLASETNEFELCSQEKFKDFDNIVSAEAGISSYQVNLGGKTLFSKTNGNIVYNNNFEMGM